MNKIEIKSRLHIIIQKTSPLINPIKCAISLILGFTWNIILIWENIFNIAIHLEHYIGLGEYL